MDVQPLYLTVHVHPHPEHRREALHLLKEMITASLEEEGCELMEFVADEASDEWLVFERWTSRELWEAHAATDRNARDGARLAPLLCEPLTLRFFVPADR